MTIRADNMTALTTIGYFKAKGPAVAKVTRELALEMANGEFAPDFLAHTPGVANFASGQLSRKFQPGVNFSLPVCLRDAREVHPADRGLEYFLSLRPPAMW